MSDAFDPYHKWLGIPRREQPANHYRLLGIAEFEDDADVIDSAANQRMSYLQDMATGPYVDDSQRILNEISAARLCLLNVQRKADYDNQLRQKLTPAAPVAASALPEDAFPQLNLSTPLGAVSARAKVAAPRSKIAKQPAAPAKSKPETETEPGTEQTAPVKSFSPMLISAISGAITLVIALVMIFKGDGKPETDEGLGTLLVVWKLDEREGAFMMIGPQVVVDGETKQLPPEEKVSFKVKPSIEPIEFTFERSGYRKIELHHKFIPGEVMELGLNWRKR